MGRIDAIFERIEKVFCAISQKWLLTVLGIVVFASRIPFITNGFGLDADAWRVASSAFHLSETGVYTASRLPGNPAAELLSALLFYLGIEELNLIAVFHSVMLAIASFLLLKPNGKATAFFGALAIAFCPIIYVNSTNAMDYVPSLGWLAVALLLYRKEKFWLAGIFFGVAVGFRLPTLAFAIVFLLVGSFNFKSLLKTGVGAFFLTLAWYSIPFSVYGLDFWAYNQVNKPIDLVTFIPKLFTSLFGLWGLVLIVLILVFGYRKLISLVLDYKAELLGVSIGVIIFISLPADFAYLMPSLFFVLLILLGAFKKLGLVLFVTFSLSALLVSTPHPYEMYKSVNNKKSISAAFTKGELFKMDEKRALLLEDIETIQSLDLTKKQLVLCGLKQVAATYILRNADNLKLVRLPEKSVFDDITDNYDTVYIMPNLKHWYEGKYQIKLPSKFVELE